MNTETKKVLGLAGQYAISSGNASIAGDKVKADQECKKLEHIMGIIKILKQQGPL